MRPRKWSLEDLKTACTQSTTLREILGRLGLKQAGGNYSQIRRYLLELNINTDHLRGRAWNKGLRGTYRPRIPLSQLLVPSSHYGSWKLKWRLIRAGLKPAHCEMCGWAQRATDGRLPLELDHINGDRLDNRLCNLRILCPNCHSLQPTHRALNSAKKSG